MRVKVYSSVSHAMTQPTLVLVTTAGALAVLLLAGLFLILRHRARVSAWVQGLFRRPPRPGRPPGPGHYYKNYWS